MKVRLTMTGDSALLMHSDKGADSLDPQARELKRLNGKRNKTEEEYRVLDNLDWNLGLYMHDDVVVLPVNNVKKCIIEGARMTKKGKDVERAVNMTDQFAPLLYDGPRDREGLYAAGFIDRRTVKVGTSRIMRCRPRFLDWGVQVDLDLNTSLMDLEDLIAVASTAGELVGIGDHRTGGYGRFTAQIEAL